jgi:hypothetical protein
MTELWVSPERIAFEICCAAITTRMIATIAPIPQAIAHARQVARPVRGDGGAGGTGGGGGVLNAPRMPAVFVQRNRKEIAFFSVKSALRFAFSQ